MKSLYYSKKGKLTVIVGKKGKDRILIWTLPEPEKLINGIISKVSFFTNEKAQKIIEKMKYLDNEAIKEIKATL